MLNVLEGYDLKANGYGSAKNIHLTAEAMRRAFADRARYLADPDFEKDIPLPMLISKDYAARQRKSINPDKASKSSTTSFEFTCESPETTHLSIVDAKRNAVAMTYTLEAGYGSKIVVPGGGLPAEQRDGRLQRRARAHRRTRPDRHHAEPGACPASACCRACRRRSSRRTASCSWSPARRAAAPSSTPCLTTILNVIDYGMNAQEAVDAGRMHHQWLPDRLSLERFGFSADTITMLKAMGHTVTEGGNQGAAQVIVFNQKDNMLEGGVDRRPSDGGAAGK